MELVLEDLAKLYNSHWIFRHLNLSIASGSRWAIRGHNGSGKSTLTAILLGLTLPTEGKVKCIKKGTDVPAENLPLFTSFASPYMLVPQELTVRQLYRNYNRFRTCSLDEEAFVRKAWLEGDDHKTIAQFSTGMVQRLRLTLALSTNSDLVILDEPTSNLDVKGKEWFDSMISEHLGPRTLIIASNEESDLSHCEYSLQISDYQYKR